MTCHGIRRSKESVAIRTIRKWRPLHAQALLEARTALTRVHNLLTHTAARKIQRNVRCVRWLAGGAE